MYGNLKNKAKNFLEYKLINHNRVYKNIKIIN
jgi:hypothetical protein